MFGRIGWCRGGRGGGRERRSRRGVRGNLSDTAATADADAKAVALDLDFRQFGFVEKLREFADQLLVDRGLVGGALVFGRHAQRLLLVFVIAARPSIAST